MPKQRIFLKNPSRLGTAPIFKQGLACEACRRVAPVRRAAMKQESVKNVLLLLAGAFVYSVGTQYFIVPAQIAPGGAVGIALMINHLTSLPIGTLTLLINLPLLVLAWFYLSHRFTVRTAAATVLVSVVLDFLVTPICPMYGGVNS